MWKKLFIVNLGAQRVGVIRYLILVLMLVIVACSSQVVPNSIDVSQNPHQHKSAAATQTVSSSTELSQDVTQRQNSTMAQSQSEIQMESEDDWWLPPWVEESPNSGVYADTSNPLPFVKARLVDLTWKEVNPSDGVYDWSKLEAALKGSNKIWLRLRTSDVIHSPSWLREKYPDLKPMRIFYGGYFDAMGNWSDGYFYPMWHAGIELELHKLLQNFKSHQFGSNPKLLFAYIPGGWRWNEFQVTFVSEMKQQSMQPKDFLAWFKRMVEEYIDAFGEENRYKLVYTGGDKTEWSDGDKEWQDELGRSISEYAINRGLSVRYGFTEAFNYWLSDAPDWGTSLVNIDNLNYMITDDNSPLISEQNRFFATENECFGGCGDEPATMNQYYYIKMTSLKSLQMRMNWINIQEEQYNKARGLFDYMLKVMGKHYYDSPDAWVDLREAIDKSPSMDFNIGIPEDWSIRNWERWLVQRDVSPDGYTVKTEPINSTWKYIDTSYEARRTDHDYGSDYIYFDVDDKFIEGDTHQVQIKVTYLDNTASTWWIEYDAADGNAYKRSTPVTNQNDQKWKTTTFEINDASFQNRQQGDMDFRIYNGGKQDITVRFARVIKLKNPLLHNIWIPTLSH